MAVVENCPECGKPFSYTVDRPEFLCSECKKKNEPESVPEEPKQPRTLEQRVEALEKQVEWLLQHPSEPPMDG